MLASTGSLVLGLYCCLYGEGYCCWVWIKAPGARMTCWVPWGEGDVKGPLGLG